MSKYNARAYVRAISIGSEHYNAIKTITTMQHTMLVFIFKTHYNHK